MVFVSACGASMPSDQEFKDFAPANFDNPTNIDNQWLPIKPGAQLVYAGYTIEAGEKVSHRIVISVTDLTKIIGGIRSVATWDLDYSADQLVEAELAFFAQDNAGNVWRMGEYPEEYEDGKFVDNPTWIHGIGNALAGIAMKANPQPGTPSYPEGWGPQVDWTDRGQVDKTVQEICVPAGCYQNVLVINESSASEPDAFQLKYYAAGMGNIQVDWTGKDQTQETLNLVEYNILSPEELAEVRVKALDLEKSAFEKSKDVYSHTKPLE
jgi:hypothetical protein